MNKGLYIEMLKLEFNLFNKKIGDGHNVIADLINYIPCVYPRKLRSTPAATAEPITPATLGPMACMRR